MLEPFLSSAVMATQAILQLGTPAQRGEWLPALASGESIAVLAHEEASRASIRMDVATRARATGDGWVLNGPQVRGLPRACRELRWCRRVSATALGLFAVPADAVGLRLLPFTTVDGQRAADVVLDKVPLGWRCPPAAAMPVRPCSGARPRHWRRCAPKPSARWTRSSPSPSSTGARASSSACRSAASRPCSTAWPTC